MGGVHYCINDFPNSYDFVGICNKRLFWAQTRKKNWHFEFFVSLVSVGQTQMFFSEKEIDFLEKCLPVIFLHIRNSLFLLIDSSAHIFEICGILF